MDQLQDAIAEIMQANPQLSRAEVEAMVADYVQDLRSAFAPEDLAEMRRGAQSFVIHAVQPVVAEVARQLGMPSPHPPTVERACLTVGQPPTLYLAVEATPAGASLAATLAAVDAVVADADGRSKMRHELGRLLTSAINQYLQELELLVTVATDAGFADARMLIAPYASAALSPQTSHVEIVGVPGFPLSIGFKALSAAEAAALAAALAATKAPSA